MGQDMMGSFAEREIREARTTIDRLTVTNAQLVSKIGRLEQEAEALREMIATITQGGAGARL